MKKLAFGIGVLLLLAIVLPTIAAPAEKIKPIDCFIPTLEGPTVLTTGMAVAASDNSGNSMIVCKAQLDPTINPWPLKAVKIDFESSGLVCGTGFDLTEDWQAVITPSGQATLTCHFKAVKA